jgi:hypothetical protein
MENLIISKLKKCFYGKKNFKKFVMWKLTAGYGISTYRVDLCGCGVM